MKLKTTLSLLALASCAAISTSAMAQSSGTINISGNISLVSCTPTLSGAGMSGGGGVYTLQLPDATITQLAAPGATSATTPFQFDWSTCATNGINNVWVNFTTPNVDGGRITPTTGSNKVRFEVLDGTNLINVTNVAAAQGSAPAIGQGASTAFAGVDPNRSANKTYGVRYYAAQGLVATDAGPVSSSVTYTAIYY